MPDTRSTRSRLRSASKSQSQSQSQSLKPHIAPPAFLHKRTRASRASQGAQVDSEVSSINDASFASASTASLPPNHSIHIALSTDVGLTESQEGDLYIGGQELLTDGWRRGEPEGKLDDLRRRNRAASGQHHDVGSNDRLGQDEKPEILWYTAGLRYPCTCELKRLKKAWTPRLSAPLPAQLDGLLSDPSQSVVIGIHTAEWSRQPLSDIDPALDNLQDFEHASHTTSTSTRLSEGVGDEGSSQKSAITVVDPISKSDSQECRRLLKGKFKATDATLAFSFLTFIASSPPVELELAPNDIRTLSTSGGQAGITGVKSRDFGLARGPLSISANTQTAHSSEILVRASDDSQDADKRRGWWRRDVRSSDGYGRLWIVIPRPHTLDYLPPMAQGKRKRQASASIPPVPNFLLPKYYSSILSHPFQSDLPRWIRSNPLERVYWLIPIHGPVYIPTYSDYQSSPPSSAPIPSAATLSSRPESRPPALEIDGRSSEKINQADPNHGKIHWTEDLLQHFWTSFLVPLQQNTSRPFGPVSIRLSGPKPDPFIDLSLPPPLPAEKDGKRPVRVEAGDHMRLYVDAKYALKLRTWLRGVEVEARHLGSYSPGAVADAMLSKGDDGMDEIIKPFSKVRLALVGLSGEVLIVA